MYTLHDTHIILATSPKKYTLTIRDLPSEDKPREKLIASGPEALSIQELFSIVLNVGTKKEGVREMASRIIREYGEKSIMSERNPKAMVKELDIPLVKATQIVACGEIGRRLFQKNDLASPTIRTAQNVFDYVVDMRDLSKEHLRGIYLNNHYKVIHNEVISIGTVDTSIIHPREVFKPAIEYSAAAVILVHNHPSGVLAPSLADIAITNQVIEAGKLLGIELIDHIIVTKSGFASVPAQYSK